MLLAIKAYLEKNQRANVSELARYCHTTPENMHSLLAHWERKGRVMQCAQPTHCGKTCHLCQPALALVYCWVTPAA